MCRFGIVNAGAGARSAPAPLSRGPQARPRRLRAGAPAGPRRPRSARGRRPLPEGPARRRCARTRSSSPPLPARPPGRRYASELSLDQDAAQQKPDRGAQRADRFDSPHHAALQFRRRELLHGAQQRRPLHAVADSPDETRQARDGQRGGQGEADVCKSHRQGAGAQHHAERPPDRSCEHQAAQHHADSPCRQQQPEAAVAGIQGRLRVGEPRSAPSAAKKTSATPSASSSERSTGTSLMCSQAARRRARTECLGLLDVRVQVDQQRAADQEGADVDEAARAVAPARRNQHAGERGAEHEGDREGRC